MKILLSIALVVQAALLPSEQIQDAREVLEKAATTMGTGRLESVQYSATGSTFGFGQAVAPGRRLAQVPDHEVHRLHQLRRPCDAGRARPHRR